MHLHRTFCAIVLVLGPTSLCGCETPPASRPQSAPDEIVLHGTAAWPADVVQAFTRELIAPVTYLGRSETPFRLAPTDPEIPFESAATFVLLETADIPSAFAAAHLAALPPVVRDTLTVSPGEVVCSTYEDVTLPEQTCVWVHAPVGVDTLTARAVGRRVRQQLEDNSVRQRLLRLRSEPGAATLPRSATGDAFALLLPAGYSWSDTSSGWPQSVQLFRAHPSRVVTVFWLEEARPEWIASHDFLVGLLRDALWRLQRDRLVESELEWDADPAGNPVLRAIWQNPEVIAGGPLQVRFVNDVTRQRLYGVVALVFLPGADKHRAMRDVRAIASTFTLQE